MKSIRIVICFFIIGVFFKTLLLVLDMIYHPDWTYRWVISYDPIGIFTAEIITSLFFSEYLAPPAGADLLFAVVLVITCGIECATLGYIMQKIITKLRSKTNF